MSYLCRARLARNVCLNTLVALLQGKGMHGSPVGQSAHHLVWSLYADTPERTRDFLWWEERPNQFLILSDRAPENRLGVFEIERLTQFEPMLKPGTMLGFSLHANPVVRRRKDRDGTRHRVKRDVMGMALQANDGEKPKQTIVRQSVMEWLRRAGEGTGCACDREEVRIGHGFTIDEDALRTSGYGRRTIGRGRGKKAIRLGVVDIAGRIQVNDPERFVLKLRTGFGAGRAFGCGLMLVRRVP